MKALSRLLLALLLAVATGGIAAQTFPSKPVRLVVPFAAGGTSDILARIVSERLGDLLGQPVLVDNRPGAGGNIGSDIVAKAAPDGHTLILASVGTHAINSSLYAKMPYDPVEDFAPITLIATVPTVLVVHPSLQVNTVEELLALARKKPGALNYASAGVGTTQHLAGEMLKTSTGIDMVHVPYKGGAPAVSDLLGGQVTLMFPNIPVVHAHISSGKLQALAVASRRRSSSLPDVPTLSEATGLADFEVSTWFGVLGPAGTPEQVVQRLHSAFVRLLDEPEIRTKMAAQGAEVLVTTPEQFRAYIRSERDKWADVVKSSGARLE